MPPGYPPFRHCHLFFYFFSIFCAQYISVSFPATYTHSRQHIQFGFCLLPELYAFIIFSFRSVLILSQVATLSSGVSRPLLQIYHTYLTYKSQPLTFGSAGQNHSNHQPFPQTPSRISRCLRATSFPRHFAAAFHSSNIPFFLFSFFYSFSFSLFFLSSSPFLFIFSLHFLFSRLFLSSFLFPFLLYVFLSNLFFLPFFSFSFFYHITLHVFLCAPSQRLQNRTQFCKPVQGHLPLAGFRGGAPYSFLFFLYV